MVLGRQGAHRNALHRLPDGAGKAVLKTGVEIPHSAGTRLKEGLVNLQVKPCPGVQIGDLKGGVGVGLGVHHPQTVLQQQRVAGGKPVRRHQQILIAGRPVVGLGVKAAADQPLDHHRLHAAGAQGAVELQEPGGGGDLAGHHMDDFPLALGPDRLRHSGERRAGPDGLIDHRQNVVDRGHPQQTPPGFGAVGAFVRPGAGPGHRAAPQRGAQRAQKRLVLIHERGPFPRFSPRSGAQDPQSPARADC